MNEKEKGPQDGIFDHMPLGLMMLVGVRCAAISNYATLDDEKRRRLDEDARDLRGQCC